jgi:hypothetical protein
MVPLSTLLDGNTEIDTTQCDASTQANDPHLQKKPQQQNQPHKFAIGWTISQTLEDDNGGHFFNSKYGIRVQGSSDSLVVWNPSHFHGTSLQEYPPSSDRILELYQDGLNFVIPNHITGLWKKYAQQRVTLKEVRKRNVNDEKDEEDED